jgi:hypothetical protein
VAHLVGPVGVRGELGVMCRLHRPLADGGAEGGQALERRDDAAR